MPGAALFGVTGRMGQALVRALRESSTLQLSGALASGSSARLGLDAAAEGVGTGISVTDDPRAALAGAAVALDFSAPQRLAAHAEACLSGGVPLLVGTTGFDAATGELLRSAAQRIAILVAPNTSVGVGVLQRLAALASAALGADFDVEILEAHHRLKRDAPSGTALALGESVAQARGQRLAEAAAYDRHGANAPRAPGSIGFSVVRGGDIVGEHTVLFAAAGERLELTHRATDRMVFARGARRAAEWLIGQPPGLYGMRDVLGL